MNFTCIIIVVVFLSLQIVSGGVVDSNVSSGMMKTFLTAITPNIDSKIAELQKVGADEDTQENVSDALASHRKQRTIIFLFLGHDGGWIGVASQGTCHQEV